MAKKTPATQRQRGRPVSENPLDNRVMVRLDDSARVALESYARRATIDKSTAARMIIVERLRREGLLK
jgi:hypothetical protein